MLKGEQPLFAHTSVVVTFTDSLVVRSFSSLNGGGLCVVVSWDQVWGVKLGLSCGHANRQKVLEMLGQALRWGASFHLRQVGSCCACEGRTWLGPGAW